MNFYGAFNSIRLLYCTYNKWGNKYSESISVPSISHFGFFDMEKWIYLLKYFHSNLLCVMFISHAVGLLWADSARVL